LGWRTSLVVLVGLVSLVLASAATAAGVTNSGDDLRTGWYPDEPGISRQIVTGGTFGQLWSATVNGQVYAQPLLAPSGTLIVATENNFVYGLDPATGATQWSQHPAQAWDPGLVGCGDIQPSIGTTSTPIIDNSTNTVYFTYKTYASGPPGPAAWYLDARDVTTGAERSGFPVPLSGNADNLPSISFTPTTQQQRPGLLLMDGVVYAAFGAHCDVSPWRGWVFGVSTTTHTVTARWVDNSLPGSGGGIWQSGYGLTSDGSGSILFITGNGAAPATPTAGSSPPTTLGESVVHLRVQPNGTLRAVDFFAPFDAAQLDQNDVDFGSGGIVGLPDAHFGTATVPHLAVAVGKEGYVYLLNRDNLGGFEQGAGLGDAVVQRTGPRGGVWGRPGVWPGDGGYVYIPTSFGQPNGGLLDVYRYLVSSGTPSLAYQASAVDSAGAPDAFGWGSGSPVITSDGTTSGSALLWIIWSSNRSGAGGQLRAYDPIPVNNQLHKIYSAPIGNSTNYSVPGVGAGHLYVGTRDGKVLAFGSPVTQPLTGSALTFPRTTVKTSSSPQTLTLTATKRLTVSSITSPSSQFTLGSVSPALPATLNAGNQISVPVTFTPTVPGVVGGQVDVTTDAGPVSFSLSGTGQAAAGELSAPTLLSLGGTEIGGHLSGSVILTNIGGTDIKVTGITGPSAPFSVVNSPANATIASGDSISFDVAFDPSQAGVFTDSVEIDSDHGGNQTVALSATAGTPGHLQFSNENIDYGATPVGSTATKSFMLTNTGGTSVTVTKSKPPFGGEFAPVSSLQEGTTIGPGATVSESVTFTPTAPGSAAGTWQINSDDGSGLHQVQFTGSGVSAAPLGGPAPPPIVVPQHPRPLVAPRFTPSVASTATVESALITYTAANALTSHFVLERATTGRRSGHRCAPTTRRNRHHPRCTRYITVTTFAHRDRVGANRIQLIAVVPKRKLIPGTYRLHSMLVDSSGHRRSFYCVLRVAPFRARR
jgi:hypothetical protein